ncbi:MAG: FumA C-terminus/TtdB family hydratase beta subunit [Oscillospiraceae bacterium]
MQREFDINTKDIRQYAEKLEVGDRVYLTGTIYTSRDQAHMALWRLLDSGEPLPFELKDAIIYYAGPTPGREGMACGACGPTTSSRMDGFTPRLLDLGLAAMIGKGVRSDEVRDSIVKNKAVYLCAVGGAGALIAKQIKSMEEIAFPELGCESIKRLQVERLPLIVGIDSAGRDIFKKGIEEFAEKE